MPRTNTKTTKPSRNVVEPIQGPGELAITSASQPSHEAIALAAYNLYEASGFQDGQDEANWLRAEAALRAQRPATPRS